jgi:hypothetical protein
MRSFSRLLFLMLALASFALAQPPLPGPEVDARFAGSALTLLACALALRKRR